MSEHELSLLGYLVGSVHRAERLWGNILAAHRDIGPEATVEALRSLVARGFVKSNQSLGMSTYDATLEGVRAHRGLAGGA